MANPTVSSAPYVTVTSEINQRCTEIKEADFYHQNDTKQDDIEKAGYKEISIGRLCSMLICPVCFVKLSDTEAFFQHTMIHQHQDLTSCYHCTRGYRSSEILENHNDTHSMHRTDYRLSVPYSSFIKLPQRNWYSGKVERKDSGAKKKSTRGPCKNKFDKFCYAEDPLSGKIIRFPYIRSKTKKASLKKVQNKNLDKESASSQEEISDIANAAVSLQKKTQKDSSVQNSNIDQDCTLYHCQECKKIFQCEKCLNNHNEEHHVNNPDQHRTQNNNLISTHIKDVCNRHPKEFPKKHLMSLTSDSTQTTIQPNIVILKEEHTTQAAKNEGESFMSVPGFNSYQDDSHINFAVSEKEFNHRGGVVTHDHLPTEKHRYEPCTHLPKKYQDESPSDIDSERKSETKFNQQILIMNNHMACEVCDKKFRTKRKLEKHAEKHIGLNPFFCIKCHKICQDKNDLLSHIAKMHKKKIVCDICLEVFRSDNAFQLHLSNKHLEKQYSLDTFVCKTCKLSYSTQTGFHLHMYKHTGVYTCYICPEKFVCRKEFSKHITQHRLDRIYLCEVCGKTTKCASGFISHQLIHSKVKPFQCKFCKRAFRKACLLRLHLLTHNNESRPFKCEKCQYTFESQTYLDRHFQTFHVDSKPFACEKCPKSFTKKQALKIHEETHDSKVHICPICGKQYKTSATLYYHQKVHKRHSLKVNKGQSSET